MGFNSAFKGLKHDKVNPFPLELSCNLRKLVELQLSTPCSICELLLMSVTRYPMIAENVFDIDKNETS
jgi:hypothetical protein